MEKTMFKVKTLAAGMIAALGLVGPVSAQSNLSAATSTPVSVPGSTILALAQLAADAGVANIQVATGQTLTNAVQNVAEGKTDIGAAPFILPFLLSKGAGPYAKIGKEKGAKLAASIAVLYTYRLAVYALASFESKGFSGYDAIEGATLYNGPPRGAALNRARALVKLATGLDEGKGYSGVQVNWGQAVKTITDGSADAVLLPMNFPDGRLSQATASGAMVIHSFPKDLFEGKAVGKYSKAPGTAAVVVDASENMFGPNTSVTSEDGMFRGIADVGGEIVNTSMDEATAYALTKAFLGGIDTMKAKAPMMPTVWLGETDPAKTGLCGPMPIKYHPGAVRAWEEAGYTLPDCAKP
jgi:TRAP-type uncharacterized transport system substrate-binding protein